MTPAISLDRSSLVLGERSLWDDLSLDVAPGEFLAVLGPNGAGKTSFLQVLLGLRRLTAGSVRVDGREPGRGAPWVGYIPQQSSVDRDVPVRGRDLVRLGVDGHRWGFSLRDRGRRGRVDAAIESVGATAYADRPLGRLSGGEQQRLRVAQALVGDPRVLLCDEPLLSLDVHHQQAVANLIDARRRQAATAVVFVSHELNPILPLVDRVLYLVGGRWAVGTPDQVITSERLSSLYGSRVDVLRLHGRIVVVGVPETAHGEHSDAHHHHPLEAELV
ncbi:MAG: metal ABC transporter ATP-binding protein [Candidatus Dormibacteria bacterium]